MGVGMSGPESFHEFYKGDYKPSVGGCLMSLVLGATLVGGFVGIAHLMANEMKAKIAFNQETSQRVEYVQEDPNRIEYVQK